MASPPKDKDKELKAGHPPAGLWKLWNGFCGRLRGLHMPEEITLILPFFISSKSWGNEDHLKTSSISSPSSYSRRESRRRRICRAKGKVSERNEKLSRVSCCTLLILQRKVHIVYCAKQSNKWSPFNAYILQALVFLNCRYMWRSWNFFRRFHKIVRDITYEWYHVSFDRERVFFYGRVGNLPVKYVFTSVSQWSISV